MSNLFTGKWQRGRVDWSAVHCSSDREFEPHQDCAVLHLEKIIHAEIFLFVIKMHCFSSIDNYEAGLNPTMFKCKGS